MLDKSDDGRLGVRHRYMYMIRVLEWLYMTNDPPAHTTQYRAHAKYPRSTHRSETGETRFSTPERFEQCISAV